MGSYLRIFLAFGRLSWPMCRTRSLPNLLDAPSVLQEKANFEDTNGFGSFLPRAENNDVVVILSQNLSVASYDDTKPEKKQKTQVVHRLLRSLPVGYLL